MWSIEVEISEIILKSRFIHNDSDFNWRDHAIFYLAKMELFLLEAEQCTGTEANIVRWKYFANHYLFGALGSCDGRLVQVSQNTRHKHKIVCGK